MAELFFHNNIATVAIRSAFYLAGIELKEHRLSRDDFNAKFPGSVSGIVLTVEGLTITNHFAAQRYAGRASKKTENLYPKDPVAAFRVDNIMEACRDLQAQVSRGKLSIGDTFPILSELMDEKFAVGDSVTIADCSIDEFEKFCSQKANNYQATLIEYGNLVRSIHANRKHALVMAGEKSRRGNNIEDASP